MAFVKVINLQPCRKRMSLDKNHELALLSNLMIIAIEHAWHPCQFMQTHQVKLRAPPDRSAGPTRTQCISGLAFQARAVQQNSGTHGRVCRSCWLQTGRILGSADATDRHGGQGHARYEPSNTGNYSDAPAGLAASLESYGLRTRSRCSTTPRGTHRLKSTFSLLGKAQ